LSRITWEIRIELFPYLAVNPFFLDVSMNETEFENSKLRIQKTGGASKKAKIKKQNSEAKRACD